MPDAPAFQQTPVLAEYREGKLQMFLQGREALDWMSGGNDSHGSTGRR
jgi:hypothetical protein